MTDPIAHIDPLKDMLQSEGLSRPDLEDVLVRWIATEFLDDQCAQLDAIGVSPDRRVRLARVFVDLAEESGKPPTPHSPPEDFPAAPPKPGLLATLLAAPTCAPGNPVPPPGSLVIGGPGQGKTTLVQYLCQLHRACILRHHRAALDPPQIEALDELGARSERDKLAPHTPRVPFFIVLRDLAAWLAKNPSIATTDAVLAHVAARIHESTEVTLPLTDLAIFVTRGPWLLVLDGLDEVPGTGGRGTTLTAINTFVERFAGTSHHVVATTRPQGYTGEFASYRAHTLAPLALDRALWYARDLATSWFPAERAVRKRLLDRLLLAAREEATARLMQSPLQVTILAALLDRVPRAPHERWRLYKLYFNTIYDRELGRRSDAADILRAQRPHIEAIHTRAALHLQVACEAEGSTSALLSHDALLAIVDARLAEQHSDAERRNKLAREILEVAANRLVFLVSPREGFYGFELRSLQEFMAAEAIMNGREQTVDGCIRRIARTTLWRNVLLFAISRCFADSHPLTEAFTVDLCEQMDSDPSDPSAVVLHLGARLALDILHEGSALYYPAITLRLLTCALSLLPGVDVGRMSEILARLHAEPDLTAETSRIVMAALGPSVLTLDRSPGNEWRLLNAACERGVAGADSLAATAWAAAPKLRKQAILALFSFETALSPWFTRMIASDLAAIDPWDLFGHRFSTSDDDPDSIERILVVNRMSGTRHNVEARSPALNVSIEFIDQGRISAPVLTPDTPSWRLFACAVGFAECPAPPTLAAAIRTTAMIGKVPELIIDCSPWPLSAALAAAESNDDLARIARLAESGALGSLSDWIAAQERWSSQGITRNDLEAFAISGSMPRPDWTHTGFPMHRPPWVHPRRHGPELASELLTLYRRATSAQAKHVFASLLSWSLIDDAEKIAVSLDATDDGLHLGMLLQAFSGDPQKWLDDLDRWFADAQRSLDMYFDPDDAKIAEPLATALANRLRAEPQRSGLRRILTAMALMLPDVMSKDLEDALATDPPDPVGRLAKLAWRISRSSPIKDDVTIWAKDFATLVKDLHHGLDDVLYSLHQLSSEVAEAFLLAALPDLDDAMRRQALASLGYIRATRRSGLHIPEVWRDLKLPEPPPDTEHDEVADEHPDDDAAYRIESIEITNVRAFEHFELRAVPPENGHGQWIVLVGENGVGKTTLLRALALALTTTANAGVALSKLPAPMRRTEVRADIEVTSRGGRRSISILGEGPNEIVKRGDGDANGPGLLVAYGCRRGSAIGGPARALLTEPIHDIHTLFDDTESGLTHAESWLKNLDHRALRDESSHARQVLDAVKNALIELLPGIKTVDIDPDNVYFEGPLIGRTKLAGLSDGYVSTLGWICDLIARWIHRQEQRGRPIPEDFPQHMTGLVLIDEIDLHLHPRWQLGVIDEVRRIFPRMSFIATTHNPLTLLGAQSGELHILRAGDRAGVVEDLQLDIVKGLRADQVLTGVWFGVASTVDPDTIRLMQRHREKIRGGAKLGDDSVTELEAEIRRRLGDHGETTLERLVAEWREKTPPRTPEEVAAVKADIRDLARRRKARRGGPAAS